MSAVSNRQSRTRKSSRGSREWPKVIRQGSVEVKIYLLRTHSPPLYCVAHYLDGKRTRKNFADAAEAEVEARRVAALMSRSDKAAMDVTSRDWRIYLLAVDALSGLDISVDAACREFAAAKKLIGDSSLLDIAKAFTGGRNAALAAISVPDLVEEFIEAKTRAGVGIRAIQDYRSRLRRFSRSFRMPVSSVTKDLLQEFIDNLKLAPRTRRNFKANLVTLLDYARSRNFLPREQKTEAEHLDDIPVPVSEIQIFPASDLGKLLAAADEKLRPYLAIRAFAGIRDSEINRMDWSNIKFDEELIEVPARAAKRTRKKNTKLLRRLVPIQLNLAEWLAPYKSRTGAICEYSKSEREAGKLAASIDVPWVHNGLRHGFGSCRVAQLKNHAEVAYEMGNTVEIVKSHYDQVVTEKQAFKWFGIFPDGGKNSEPSVAG